MNDIENSIKVLLGRIDGFKNGHRMKFYRKVAENKIPQGMPYKEPEIPAEWLEEVCAIIITKKLFSPLLLK